MWEFFLHLIQEPKYAPQSIRQARLFLTAFYMEMLGRPDWTVLASLKTKDPVHCRWCCRGRNLRSEMASPLGCPEAKRMGEDRGAARSHRQRTFMHGCASSSGS